MNNKSHITVDKNFEAYFKGRLKQVFIYITDRCQLRCEHCLYKTSLSNREMDLSQTIQLINVFKRYGARKMTLLGGEPTLWGNTNNYSQLLSLLKHAKSIGYEYIRIDTNGQFRHSFIEKVTPDYINDLAFSLDGHTPEINDKLRGQGSFIKTVRNIEKAIKKNIYSTITTCVHPGNIKYLNEMILLAIRIGVKQINFHPMFKMGVDRDLFTGNTHITLLEWLNAYEEIRDSIAQNKFNIEIRISRRFISEEEYINNKEVYSFCPQKLGERILIHPNGELRICALTIGSKFHIGKYDNEKISWNHESCEIETCHNPYACNIQKNIFGKYFPLCISFKPYQNEFVWKSENFDSLYSI